jgi:hypothetical protein
MLYYGSEVEWTLGFSQREELKAHLRTVHKPDCEIDMPVNILPIPAHEAMSFTR